MIAFIKRIFGKDDSEIPTPEIKNQEYDKPFDDVRISVLRSDYEALKTQLFKSKTTIRNLKKKLSSLKKK